MSQEDLTFAIPSGTDGQPATELILDLTLSGTLNSDGSYTVTAATGSFGALQIIGLAPLGTDGSDNELFLNGAPYVSFGGITFVTNGTPDGATALGQTSANPADLNLFYTGTSIAPNDEYGLDTPQVTALSEPTAVYDPSCFFQGTLVRTPGGATPVEQLKRGDLVTTLGGEAKPVLWIGRRAIAAPFCDPIRCWPIRVRAGALGDNIPSRDLLLSPDHALLIDDLLIHAGALVNGTSVLRETAVPGTFVYFHVELDDHALIFAEDTPAESFVDNVDRLGFDNWAEHEALYPEGRPIEEMPYPRAKARRQIPMAIRAALDQRANLLGAARFIAAA